MQSGQRILQDKQSFDVFHQEDNRLSRHYTRIWREENRGYILTTEPLLNLTS